MSCTIRNEKRNFLENIDTKKITDNKIFYETVKTFISNKCRSSENIALAKGDDTISDKSQVESIFNESFANVVEHFNVADEDILCDTNWIDHPVLKAMEKCKRHPSINAVKNIGKNNSFSFQKVSYE